jgi:hypothetical protein
MKLSSLTLLCIGYLLRINTTGLGGNGGKINECGSILLKGVSLVLNRLFWEKGLRKY